MHLDSRGDLNRTLLERQHAFLEPNIALHNSFLQITKELLDPVANDVTEAQTEREKVARNSKKRKRKLEDDEDEAQNPLRMKRLHITGFDVAQVWSQASRVVEATLREVERQLPETSPPDIAQARDNAVPVKSVRFDDDGFEVVGSSEDESLGEEGLDWEYDGDDVSENSESIQEPHVNGDDLQGDSDEESQEGDGETPISEYLEAEDPPAEQFVPDKFGLNDGFFSIDDFNRKSQFLERQDAKGDPDDGAASDEEDIDWEVDPLLIDPGSGTSEVDLKQKQRTRDKSPDEDDAGDGPTFGDVDLDAPDSDSDEDMEIQGHAADQLDLGDFSNTNNILYADFFAPPARKAGQKSNKNNFKSQQQPKKLDSIPSAPQEVDDEQDDMIQRTISGVHRDLFDDDDDDPPSADEDDELEDNLTASQRNANLSTHERRQLALRAEIRRLEAENVSEKPWSMTGETVAPARPLNSLLEEDLDFERAGKPVPVVTADVNESIEDLIKRRILAREFDEVVRRRPTDSAAEAGSDARRGRLPTELSDAKPTMSLAEQYEQDHLRRTDPNYVDSRSEALKKTHAQIEAQWKEVSAQLDSLSNWHYKPRPPTVNLDVRVDAPTISMEDVRPSTSGEVGNTGILAPQEVWKPGEEGRSGGQVVTKGGTAVAKEEESREQKTRRRRREKERLRKANANTTQPGANDSQQARTKGQQKRIEQNQVVGQLKKGGVQMIGKKGELTDIEGQKTKKGGQNRGLSGENFKL